MQMQKFFENVCFEANNYNLCSGYLRKQTAVVSIVLPFTYDGLTHYAVVLNNSHRKKGRNS